MVLNLSLFEGLQKGSQASAFISSLLRKHQVLQLTWHPRRLIKLPMPMVFVVIPFSEDEVAMISAESTALSQTRPGQDLRRCEQGFSCFTKARGARMRRGTCGPTRAAWWYISQHEKHVQAEIWIVCANSHGRLKQTPGKSNGHKGSPGETLECYWCAATCGVRRTQKSLYADWRLGGRRVKVKLTAKSRRQQR